MFACLFGLTSAVWGFYTPAPLLCLWLGLPRAGCNGRPDGQSGIWARWLRRLRFASAPVDSTNFLQMWRGIEELKSAMQELRQRG
jgi:hypothetical protein